MHTSRQTGLGNGGAGIPTFRRENVDSALRSQSLSPCRRKPGPLKNMRTTYSVRYCVGRGLKTPRPAKLRRYTTRTNQSADDVMRKCLPSKQPHKSCRPVIDRRVEQSYYSNSGGWRPHLAAVAERSLVPTSQHLFTRMAGRCFFVYSSVSCFGSSTSNDPFCPTFSWALNWAFPQNREKTQSSHTFHKFKRSALERQMQVILPTHCSSTGTLTRLHSATRRLSVGFPCEPRGELPFHHDPIKQRTSRRTLRTGSQLLIRLTCRPHNEPNLTP